MTSAYLKGLRQKTLTIHLFLAGQEMPLSLPTIILERLKKRNVAFSFRIVIMKWMSFLSLLAM